MSRTILLALGAALSGISVMGCGQSSAGKVAVSLSTDYHLQQEPAGAIEIMDAKDEAKDGEPIVVVGRVGGGLKPWIDGRAAFLLVDTRILPTCNEGEKCDENCPSCADAMLSASTMVKFMGNDGKVLPVDARDLLGVKEQQTLVVRGVANRDTAGNMTIAAEKIYVRR